MARTQVSRFSAFLVLVLVFGLFCATASAQSDSPRKIVVLRQGALADDAQADFLRSHGATPIKRLGLINAVAARVPAQAERALLGRSEVARIDEDIIVSVIAPGGAKGKPQPAPAPPQELPWGVDRVNADAAWATTSGAAVKVAVIDTGILLKHDDLKVNIKGGVNTINLRKSPNDDHGHGTHVAGIIAAANNAIGVVGVGPEIHLYAVKVLGSNGSGWLSDIIEGLEWCVANGMQVANMSIGSSAGNDSYQAAIAAAYNAGIVIVAAAGNNGTTTGLVDYPAKYSQVIAVSATTVGDALASFSSYGIDIDLAAPGASIKSTYKDGGYALMSGTSMAAPHVTGAAALVLTRAPGASDANGNGAWDPAEVRARLKATAENLGLSDVSQGAGLVRADLAVQ